MAASNLVSSLEDFYKIRQSLTAIYDKTRDQFEKIRQILADRDHVISITPQKDAVIQKALTKDPVVVIVGQTNSGKTSFVNELLGGSYLPTHCIPCTARVVKVQYSEENYLQLFGPDGIAIGERVNFKKKKVPRDKIELSDAERSEEDQVQYTVEVGINHDLLKGGLRVMDVPGLSENEVLDKLVSECLDGILQVLIYIIDGKYSLRCSDTEFLLYLKRVAPTMEIIYVCNKIDISAEATEADGYSDPEDSDEESEPNEVKEERRAQSAFTKLKKNGLLDEKLEYSHELDFYHSISCEKLRQARHCKPQKEDRYTDAFARLRQALQIRFTTCINRHLLNAVDTLLAVQSNIFVVFVTDEMTQFKSTIEGLKGVAGIFLELEKAIYNCFEKQLKNELYGKVETLVDACRVSRDKDMILESARYLELNAVDFDELIGRKVVRDYVLHMVCARMDVRLLAIQSVFSEIASKIKSSLTDSTNEAHALLRMHLHVVWERNDLKTLMGELKKVWAAAMYKQVEGALNEHYKHTNQSSKYKYPSERWKKDTAALVLQKIDSKAAAKIIVDAIRLVLEAKHEAFNESVNQMINAVSITVVESRKESLKNLVPQFSKNVCVAEALCKTVTYGYIPLGDKIRDEDKLEVFECDPWGNIEGLVEAKKKKSKRGEPSTSFSANYCYARFLEHGLEIETKAIAFDRNWDFVMIEPKQ